MMITRIVLKEETESKFFSMGISRRVKSKPVDTMEVEGYMKTLYITQLCNHTFMESSFNRSTRMIWESLVMKQFIGSITDDEVLTQGMNRRMLTRPPQETMMTEEVMDIKSTLYIKRVKDTNDMEMSLMKNGTQAGRVEPTVESVIKLRYPSAIHMNL
jgi:hypothetical protein